MPLGGPPQQTFELIVAAGEPTLVDELEPGLGQGDWLLFDDPVLDDAGQTIGNAITRVQIIAPVGDNDLAYVLDCTISLDKGRLVLTGADQISHLDESVTYAVTGGTGAFSGVRGQVTGTQEALDGAPVTRLTFDIRTR